MLLKLNRCKSTLHSVYFSIHLYCHRTTLILFVLTNKIALVPWKMPWKCLKRIHLRFVTLLTDKCHFQGVKHYKFSSLSHPEGRKKSLSGWGCKMDIEWIDVGSLTTCIKKRLCPLWTQRPITNIFLNHIFKPHSFCAQHLLNSCFILDFDSQSQFAVWNEIRSSVCRPPLIPVRKRLHVHSVIHFTSSEWTITFLSFSKAWREMPDVTVRVIKCSMGMGGGLPTVPSFLSAKEAFVCGTQTLPQGLTCHSRVICITKQWLQS